MSSASAIVASAAREMSGFRWLSASRSTATKAKKRANQTGGGDETNERSVNSRMPARLPRMFIV